MLLRVFLIISFLGSVGSIFAQINQTASVEKEVTENWEYPEVPYEIKKHPNLDTKTQQAYNEIISRLYKERKKYTDNLSTLESTEVKEKEALRPDAEKLEKISTGIYEVKKRLNEIRADLKGLESEYAKSASSSTLKRLIEEVNKNYKTDIVNETETTEEWDNEFDYLKPAEIMSEPVSISNCQIVFNGVDPNTLQKKIQLQPENLISYTHPKLESYYKENSFLTGDVSLVQLGKEEYLVLDIVIRSRDALKNYGIIQIGSPMKIELINGESVYLFAAGNAEGKMIPQTNHVRYQVLYNLYKAEYKQLRKSEIDNLGLMWSSGYEKYDIYNIDVLLNQIDCLENYK